MEKGFTIVELIITIFILSIAILGVFGAFSMMLILTSTSSDRLTAAYLAQEGMEIIRNIRDTNWIEMRGGSEIPWDDGFSTCKNTSGCQVDYTTTNEEIISSSSGEKLQKDPNNFYSYQGGTPTKFTREIKIICLPTGDCSSDYIMKVSVEVSWEEKPNILNPTGYPGGIKVEDTLYNWY